MTATVHAEPASAACLPLPPRPARARRAMADFMLTIFGVTEDRTAHFRELGPIFRLPSVVRPLKPLVQLGTIRGWNAEFVFITKPALVRELFTQDPGAIDFEAGKEFFRFAMGVNSPFILDGKPHAATRQVLNRELTQRAIEQYRELSVIVLDRMIDELPLGTRVSLRDLYARFTQEMLLRITFGLENQAEIDGYRELLHRSTVSSSRWRRLLQIPLLNQGNPWSHGRDELNRLFRRGATMRTRADRELGRQIARLRGAAANDTVGARIAAKVDGTDPIWNDKVVRDVLATLLIAGHETSVSAYSWAADYLLHNPRERDLLVAEAQAGETDRYAQAVNNEALRLRPPFYGPWVVPYRDIAVGGYRIRKGTFVMVPPLAVHQDPAAYPEPKSFRPERFLDKAPDRYGFITFSAGRHRCPGINFFMVEANIALHRVFGRLELAPCNPPAKSRNYLAILNHPRGGLEVVIQSRKPAADVPWYQPSDDAGREQNALMRAPIPEDFPVDDGSVLVTEPALASGAPDRVAVCPYGGLQDHRSLERRNPA